MTRSLATALSLGALLSPAATGVAAAGEPAPFGALVRPAARGVVLGDSIEVTFEVDATGVQFNAFDVQLSYDPSYLTLVSIEEGELVTSSGCDTWWLTETSPPAVRATSTLLCSGGTLDGPGVLVRLVFRGDALGSSPITVTSPPDRTFADDGLWVAPTHPTFPRQVVFTDAVVDVVDEVTAVGGDADVAPGAYVRFAPNPTRGPGVFHLDGVSPGRLVVVDAGGRIVWQRAVSGGAGRIAWDGRTSRGHLAQPGAYFYRLEGAGGASDGRLVILP